MTRPCCKHSRCGTTFQCTNGEMENGYCSQHVLGYQKEKSRIYCKHSRHLSVCGQYRKRFWLVGCFGFNGPLRQYFSLYRAVSQRQGERRERIDESKNVQTTPTRTYYKRNRPLPYCNQNCRTPRHWKFTQHHRTTRPPPETLLCQKVPRHCHQVNCFQQGMLEFDCPMEQCFSRFPTVSSRRRGEKERKIRD